MRKDTKARDFDRVAKQAISERDSIDGWPCCVNCGAAAPAPLAWSNAHFISRAQVDWVSRKTGLHSALCATEDMTKQQTDPPCGNTLESTCKASTQGGTNQNYTTGRFNNA